MVKLQNLDLYRNKLVRASINRFLGSKRYILYVAQTQKKTFVMWNNLSNPKKVEAIQTYIGCLREKGMFKILAVTTSIVNTIEEGEKLFDDIKFIQDEGVSLGMLELSLKGNTKE